MKATVQQSRQRRKAKQRPPAKKQPGDSRNTSAAGTKLPKAEDHSKANTGQADHREQDARGGSDLQVLSSLDTIRAALATSKAAVREDPSARCLHDRIVAELDERERPSSFPDPFRERNDVLEYLIVSQEDGEHTNTRARNRR